MKVSVAYDHDPADLAAIHLAVLPDGITRPPVGEEWQAAFRDLDAHGRPVLWIKTEQEPGRVWLLDAAGERPVRPQQ